MVRAACCITAPTDDSPEKTVPEPNKPSPKQAVQAPPPQGLPRAQKPARAARVKTAPVPWPERCVGFLASTVVHALVVIALALLLPLDLATLGRPELQFELADDSHPEVDTVTLNVQPAAQPEFEMGADIGAASPQTGLTIESPLEQERREQAPQEHGFGIDLPPGEALIASTPAGMEGALRGRQPGDRERLAMAEGGTPASEAAVERGLAWLAKHQRRDGSWHFDHNLADCQGMCRNPGDHHSTVAATAVAILPFLGAGYTHRQGPYQQVVDRGLSYLKSRMRTTPHGGDLREGTMYAQGLAAIALCEAYGMTRDPSLREAAQAAIDYIVWAQDQSGGGWRYAPGEVGDTTVTGWQLMALKSAQMSYLRVPGPVFNKVTSFLNGVQADGGARYGYLTAGKEPTTTAVGLLCRMYLGWGPDSSPLRMGVKYLSEHGPSTSDMYFNYYATQVMHHFGGPLWEPWNEKMREHLIQMQATQGHESGSWYFRNRHTDPGGRLLVTALAVMTLEVYYRHMPIYRPTVLDTPF